MKKVHIFIQKAMEDQQTIWPRGRMRDRIRNHTKSSAVGLSKELPVGKPELSNGEAVRTAQGQGRGPQSHPGKGAGGTMPQKAATRHAS